MRCPSRVSIASPAGSSRPSNWPWRYQSSIAKALHKATETVCMSNNGKRVAWVTGGGSGIGEAGAEALAADGWTVVVSGRRKDALDAVVAKITASGGKAEAMALDVSKAADVNRAAEPNVSRHGRIDLLVNNAGVNVPKRSWADMELEGWNKVR